MVFLEGFNIRQGRSLSRFSCKDVLNDERKAANAVWWGLDKNDSTDTLQGAIISGVSKVVVPYKSSDWVVRLMMGH